MIIRLGTSSWYFSDEEHLIYPEKIKPIEKLKYYSKEFNTVEVNTTFYHFPRKTTIEKWFSETGDDFKFIIKLNRYFTHETSLSIDEESKDKLSGFMELINGLENKLGGILIQFPASFKIDLNVLETFLNYLNKLKHSETRVFLEVRDDSWIIEDFFKLLKRKNVNLVYSDSRTKWPKILKLTGDTLYLRLHGREKLYHSSYSREELEEFLKQVEAIGEDAYIFLNNTAISSGIKNAITMKELISL